MANFKQRLSTFFESDIFVLHEDEVDTFLSNYPPEEVVECLTNKLKLLSVFRDGDEAWRLGRIFCYISSKYSADTQVYSLLNTSTLFNRESMMHFLSGYWYGDSNADLEIVVKIAEEVVDAIANTDNVKCIQNLILVAIEAVSVAYSYNEQSFKDNRNLDKQIKEKTTIFKKYVLEVVPTSTHYQLLLNIKE
ncbi:hypothetical protein [Aliterella atlantica]|uniref:Uncharacterized protein n=1 Tax=Aliterella atlantica CENA595 TaxID=1618023 RepID=A0A0D8ZU32_9CYAN|nr:hypothetical protein [Aliterella atlantica]KJH70746.1 hypothetical protein UH38_16035 [Aliterella atlantica CENA595]